MNDAGRCVCPEGTTFRNGQCTGGGDPAAPDAAGTRARAVHIAARPDPDQRRPLHLPARHGTGGQRCVRTPPEQCKLLPGQIRTRTAAASARVARSCVVSAASARTRPSSAGCCPARSGPGRPLHLPAWNGLRGQRCVRNPARAVQAAARPDQDQRRPLHLPAWNGTARSALRPQSARAVQIAARPDQDQRRPLHLPARHHPGSGRMPEKAGRVPEGYGAHPWALPGAGRPGLPPRPGVAKRTMHRRQRAALPTRNDRQTAELPSAPAAKSHVADQSGHSEKIAATEPGAASEPVSLLKHLTRKALPENRQGLSLQERRNRSYAGSASCPLIQTPLTSSASERWTMLASVPSPRRPCRSATPIASAG